MYSRKLFGLTAVFLALAGTVAAQPTQKPVLHGQHWVAITGKPLGATAGAMMFQQCGTAVDAACAMLGATVTMYDARSWGGETQALIYHPGEQKVIGINALGITPTGATPEYFKSKGMDYPPARGRDDRNPWRAHGDAGRVRHLELERRSRPANRNGGRLGDRSPACGQHRAGKGPHSQWPYSRETFLTHLGEKREAPYPNEVFRQLDLKATS